jgi:hypothetical protein
MSIPTNLWSAVAEVRIDNVEGFAEDVAGAFVQVAGVAASESEFCDRVREALCDMSVTLVELTETAPVDTTDHLEELLVDTLRSAPTSIAFGTFNTYPMDA